MDPEGLTPQHVRVHPQHVGVQEVGHEIILHNWRLIQDHCLRRTRSWLMRALEYVSVIQILCVILAKPELKF